MNSTTTVTTKVSRKQAIVAAGRAHLKEWLLAAEAHGTIYYNIQSVSRSGMNRKISLATIIDRKGQPELVRLWPHLSDEQWERAAFHEYNAALDIIARDWGFSFKARAFDVSGAGMDMTFALVYRLAEMALPREDALPYANRVRREVF